MFKMIKFGFWIVATIIVAYFIADIKIGDQSVKTRLDNFVSSEKGSQLISDGKKALQKMLETALNLLNETKEATPKATPKKVTPPKPEEAQLEEAITQEAQDQLKELIKKH